MKLTNIKQLNKNQAEEVTIPYEESDMIINARYDKKMTTFSKASSL